MNKRNCLLNHAMKCLTETERELIGLLTGRSASRDTVLAFIKTYDIENEKASDSFLINYLLRRFDISETEDPKLPRIMGMKEYYRFQNINVLKTLDNVCVFDADLYLRIINKDDVRTFTDNNSFINEDTFRSLMGEKYTNRYKAALKEVSYNGRSFFVPGESFLKDLIYIKIYYSLIYGVNRFSFACYVYDVFRYTPDGAPGRAVKLFVLKKTIRHFFGKIRNRMFKWIASCVKA